MVDLARGAPRYFMGYPVVISQVLPSGTGSQRAPNILAFGNMQKAVLFGDRRGISVRVSNDRYFDTDEVGIRGTERFDINVHERGTATTPGALIVMQTAAS